MTRAMARPPAVSAVRRGDTLVVAGLWVRAMAESARRAGWRVIALDLFGDRDTRRASDAWSGIGDPAAMALDLALLDTALRRAAADERVFGWVAGSGFEPAPQGLDLAADVLPRLGSASADMRRLRDPAAFFSMLSRLGLPHPPTGPRVPGGATDWLLKDLAASGGWHVRRASPGDTASGTQVMQQQVSGVPMSALFLADGLRASLLGLNLMQVRQMGAWPFVYQGAIGPVDDDGLRREALASLAALVPAFGLRGLMSLDFIADGGRLQILEINPRPSASMVLYDDALPRGLMQAHVAASCGDLPAAPPQASGMRGSEIVFAERAVDVTAALSDRLAALPRCHDLPHPGVHVAAGEPLCSVSASAHDAPAVLAALAGARVRVWAAVDEATGCAPCAAWLPAATSALHAASDDAPTTLDRARPAPACP